MRELCPQIITPLHFVKMHGYHGNPLDTSHVWGYTYKISHISAAISPRPLNSVSYERHILAFYLIIKNAKYLICIFMNIN